MRIVPAYVAAGTVRAFAVLLAVATAISVLIAFCEDIDDLVDARVSSSTAFQLIVYRVPAVMSLMTPIALALAVVVNLGLMSRSNELIAIEAGGIADRRLLWHLAIVGVAFGIAHFAFSEVVVPGATRRAGQLWRERVNELHVDGAATPVWIETARFVCRAASVDTGGRVLSGVTVYFLGADHRIARRLDAREARYTSGGWVFHDAKDREWDRDRARHVSNHANIAVDIDMWPGDFVQRGRCPEELSYREMLGCIERAAARGEDLARLRVNSHARLSFSFACVVLAIGGAVVGLSRKRGRLLITVAWGASLTFCYWLAYTYSVSLGCSRALGPVTAAWAPNAVFVVGACVAFGLGGRGPSAKATAE